MRLSSKKEIIVFVKICKSLNLYNYDRSKETKSKCFNGKACFDLPEVNK